MTKCSSEYDIETSFAYLGDFRLTLATDILYGNEVTRAIRETSQSDL